MALAEYNKKRKFNKTSEPKGKLKAKSKAKGEANAGDDDKLVFVIQKHAASRLHYDFRLEIDGVLKSWAVPKGPPLEAGTKHLAMMVEDHPYDYRDFEGTIPEGEYGAGTVMLWDEGTYEVIEYDNKLKKVIERDVPLTVDEQQKLFHKQIKDSDVKVRLYGKKLKGEFALIRFKRAGDDAWLMLRHKDESAGKEIPDVDLSVRSGRSMDEITADSAPEGSAQLEAADFPSAFSPMLATLVEEIPGTTSSKNAKPSSSSKSKSKANSDWQYEPKWDGYRLLSFKQGEEVRLYSRNQVNYTEKFAAVTSELQKLPLNIILDGEIVALDSNGKASFESIQNVGKTAKDKIIYYVFDVLYLDKFDLRNQSLANRHKLLTETLEVLKKSKLIKLSPTFTDAASAEKYVKQNDLEGIVAKLLSSHYISDRSHNWQKVKFVNEDDFIICGYTKPKKSRKGFGSLILGEMQYGKLKYVGLVGTGISDSRAEQIKKQLDKIKTDTPVFDQLPAGVKVDTWIEPKISCQVRYIERTSEGVLRQSMFLGFRNDK